MWFTKRGKAKRAARTTHALLDRAEQSLSFKDRGYDDREAAIKLGMERAGVNAWSGGEGQAPQRAVSFDELMSAARMYVDRGMMEQALGIASNDQESVGTALMCACLHIALAERDPMVESDVGGVTRKAKRILPRIN
jgi:hypothetical protein